MVPRSQIDNFVPGPSDFFKMATEDVDAVSSFGRRMKVKTKKMEARIESVRHETNVDDPERDIAASLLEESKEELERRVKLWPIVILAREADLVDDVFVDSLMKQGSSANSNTTNLWMFISKIKEKESWFSRFLNVLSISPSYRPLAEQLSRSEPQPYYSQSTVSSYVSNFQLLVFRFALSMCIHETTLTMIL